MDAPLAIAAAPEPPGLTSAEAARRLAADGPNAAAENPPPSLPRRLAGHLWAPVPWMLEAAILLQLLLGAYAEAAVIAGLLLLNVVVAVVQEGRADAALAAMRTRLAPTARVRRDGAWRELPAREAVAGDAVHLGLGGQVPADLRLVSGHVLLDASAVTGEALPVEAGPGATAPAGAFVRGGEAVGEVTATGARTAFGRAAELVRAAHAESGQARAVMRMVRDLTVANGAIVVAMLAWGHHAGLAGDVLLGLALTALLASVPVGLPAMFTLAAALSAKRLGGGGVLLTRLAAVDEAAAMTLLLSDKTGTLTRSELRVEALRPLGGADEGALLEAALLASASDGAGDALEEAIRAAAPAPLRAGAAGVARVEWHPFDPATKLSEAVGGTPLRRAVKGAFAAVAARTVPEPDAAAALAALEGAGLRVLAVAAGPATGPLRLLGLIGLGDPPREDAAPLVAGLAALGVRTVMVTGDAPGTAAAVAHAVGIAGPVRAGVPEDVGANDAAGAFAGVLPADKWRLVKAMQGRGLTVGMCGDGANDAAALRQANLGIAVSTATDVAKAAAGAVLTRPGLAGVLAAVREGRAAHRRVLAYALNSLVKKAETVPLLALGLALTGAPVLTPLAMVLLLVAGDTLTLALAADPARPGPSPERWQGGALIRGALALAALKLLFTLGGLLLGRAVFGLDAAGTVSLAFLLLAFGGQAAVHALRGGAAPVWHAGPPGAWLVAAGAVDVAIAVALVWTGTGLAMLPPALIAAAAAWSALCFIALTLTKTPLLRTCGLDAAVSAPLRAASLPDHP